MLELRARVASNLERAAARSQDASWRRAVTDGLHDALLVLDLDGTVLEVNDRFTSLLGWSPADGPFSRPYPWDAHGRWPSPAGFADAVDLATASPDATGPVEVALRHRDGRRVVGSVRVSTVQGGRGRPSRLLATVRDVTAEHEARKRRATAAALSAELGSAEELTDVVAAAVAGLSVLFGGDATVSVVVGSKEQVFTAFGPGRPAMTSTRRSPTGSTARAAMPSRRPRTVTSTASCSRRGAERHGAGSGSRSPRRAP